MDPVFTTLEPLTTTIPPYVYDNLSSGPIEFNYCASSTTNEISCPAGYVISEREAFYGKSTDNNCFYTPGDCKSTVTIRCAGKNSCKLPVYNAPALGCGTSPASYLRVEYECVPTKGLLNQINWIIIFRKELMFNFNYTDKIEPVAMCGKSFSNKNLMLKSDAYPNYEADITCTTTIEVDPSSTIKVFIHDLAINTE